MRLHGRAMRLTVAVRQTDRYRHRPLYVEIIARARRRGLAGASAFRGIEGFGAAAGPGPRPLSSVSALPIVVVIVDTARLIEPFAAEIAALVPDGALMLDRVEVYRYVGRESAAERPRKEAE